MVARKTLKKQLADLKLRGWIFGRAEIKELRKLLNPDEIVKHCAYGYYTGGSGLLVATNERILLVDKQPLYLNVEEISYESVRSVECRQKNLQALISICTSMKRLQFRSFSDARLKLMEKYVSERALEAQNVIANNITQEQSFTPTPYINSGWRHRTGVILPRRIRRHPSKFHGPNTAS